MTCIRFCDSWAYIHQRFELNRIEFDWGHSFKSRCYLWGMQNGADSKTSWTMWLVHIFIWPGNCISPCALAVFIVPFHSVYAWFTELPHMHFPKKIRFIRHVEKHLTIKEPAENKKASWLRIGINLVISMQPCWTSSISLSSFVVVIIIYDSFSGSTPTPFILEHFIWSWGSIIICNSHSYCNSSMENLRSSCSPTTSISASTSTSISASTSTSISASGQIQHQRQLLLPGHHQPVHGSKEFQMVWWHLAAQSTFDLIPKLWQKWLFGRVTLQTASPKHNPESVK